MTKKYYIIRKEEVKENGCDCGEPYCTILSKTKLVDLDEAAEQWHHKRSLRWDYDKENTLDGLPCIRYDTTFSKYLETQQKEWWLEKDCRKCQGHPDCEFVETKADKPRGCSLFREAQNE